MTVNVGSRRLRPYAVFSLGENGCLWNQLYGTMGCLEEPTYQIKRLEYIVYGVERNRRPLD